MSYIESVIATGGQSSYTAAASTAAEVNCTRRPSDSGALTRKRQDAFGRKVNGQRSKAKLQKLQEKVKIHQQCVQESIRSQPGSANPSLTAASTPGDSMFPTPAIESDIGLDMDFLMAPLEHFDSDYTPYRARVANQEAALNSLQSPSGFTHTTSFPSWDMLYGPCGPYGPQEPLTPGPSCSASDMLTGFTMEDPFSSAQSLQCLQTDEGAQSRLCSEQTEVTREDDRRRADTPDSPQARVRRVIEQAAAVGFESLDDAIAAYYTETFEDMPSLYQQQRLNRNRRLPRLLNALHSAAKGWSEWERRGFQEQMTLGAEELLVQELSTFITQQGPAGYDNKSAKNEMGETRIGSREDVTTRRHRVQNNLPNLWALTTALLAKTDPFGQESRPDTVLEIIEALCHGRGDGFQGGQDQS